MRGHSEVILKRECLYAELGLMSVQAAELLMGELADLRVGGAIPDLVLFMSHPRTVALGLRDRNDPHPKDLLVSPQRLEEEGIALSRSVRGGGVTYHWPGQVACYPVLMLTSGERDVPGYMRKLEEVCIRALKSFGVLVERRRDTAAHVGLWFCGKKVVSMGIRISRWVTNFGFVINVEGDHKESAYVRPCGINGAELATLEEILGKAPPRYMVMEALKNSFAEVFGRVMKRSLEIPLRQSSSPAIAGGDQKTGSGWVR